MRAIGYVRVSTDEQVREGVSIENQVAKIEAYAQLNDIDLVQIIHDGKSGKNLRRPGIQKALDLVSGKGIDALIVYKLDRLSRRTIDNLHLIETFEKNGVAFHSLMEKIDTKSAMGRFFLTITAAYAQMERDLISERTTDALAHKRQNGQKTGGDVPFGFDAANGDLVPNEGEQHTVKMISALRGNGMSLRQIASELDDAGHTTKHGSAWKPTQVRRVLRRIGLS